jgi:hypothetical protein
MILPVNLLESRFIDVRIHLRRGHVNVSEEFLDDAEVGAAGKQVRGEAVAKRVR